VASYPRRSIPPVLDDPRISALTLDQQRTLILLPLALDDSGRALDDAGTINGLLWGRHWEEHPPAELDRDLDALAAARFVTRYEVDGVRYVQMLDWDDVQVISRRRPSRYPAPPTGTRSRAGAGDHVWTTVEGLVNVVSGAAEKLHDPAVQAKGVRLLADLAGQIDPGLAGKVREKARPWVGSAADPSPGTPTGTPTPQTSAADAPQASGPGAATDAAEATAADTIGPARDPGPDGTGSGSGNGDPWRRVSDV
jgi:hypothetical protein